MYGVPCDRPVNADRDFKKPRLQPGIAKRQHLKAAATGATQLIRGTRVGRTFLRRLRSSQLNRVPLTVAKHRQSGERER